MPYVPYYDPTGWADDPSTASPITAAALNYIEAGVETAQATAEAAQGDITTDPAWAAKGDLMVATADNAASVLSVGANDEVPVAASGQSHGIVWQKIGNAQIATNAAIARSKLVAETRALPIQLSTPASSVTAIAGNAFWTAVALTDWDAGHWEFTKDVKGKVYGIVKVPAGISVTGGNIVLEISANATSGVTRLQVAHAAIADGESMNPGSLTDITAQDITVPATAYLRKKVTFAVTASLAGDDIVLIEVFHEGDHANDTLAVNTLLWGAWLEVSVS